MLRIAIIAIVVVVLLVLAVVAVGYALPVAHVASRAATLPHPPDRVFQVLSDVTHYADWRTDVTRVELLSSEPLRWRETGSNGEIAFVVLESAAPLRLVTRIDDRSLPFGGTWTYDLVPVSGGTSLTITERGEVYNPLFRFMSRFVFGQTASMEAYLAALATRLGE